MPRKEEISKWDSLSKEKIQEILNMHDKYGPLNVYFNRHFEAYKRRLTETKGSKFCRLPMRFHWTSSPPHFRSVLRSPLPTQNACFAARLVAERPDRFETSEKYSFGFPYRGDACASCGEVVIVRCSLCMLHLCLRH